MKPKCIGIVGGAGPLAGALLLERILSLSSQIYDCYRDADFPKVFLLSFPFSEMLTELDRMQLEQEVSECLQELRKNGASVCLVRSPKKSFNMIALSSSVPPPRCDDLGCISSFFPVGIRMQPPKKKWMKLSIKHLRGQTESLSCRRSRSWLRYNMLMW